MPCALGAGSGEGGRKVSHFPHSSHLPHTAHFPQSHTHLFSQSLHSKWWTSRCDTPPTPPYLPHTLSHTQTCASPRITCRACGGGVRPDRRCHNITYFPHFPHISTHKCVFFPAPAEHVVEVYGLTADVKTSHLDDFLMEVWPRCGGNAGTCTGVAHRISPCNSSERVFVCKGLVDMTLW